MRKLLALTISSAVAAGSLALGGAAAYLDKEVTLIQDGNAQQINVWGTTVADALTAQGITISDHDQVIPSQDTKLSEGTVIDVRYGRQITITVDGTATALWTTATSVSDALDQLGLHSSKNWLSVDRSSPIGRDGLEIEAVTPKNVTLKADGKTTSLVTTSLTVQDLLTEQGITLGPNDRISPALDTRLVDGTAVVAGRVTYQEETTTAEIDFTTEKTDSDLLPIGVTVVDEPGVKGEKNVTTKITYLDGVEESREVIKEETTKEPVAEKVQVGTMARTTSNPDYQERIAWMKAAGIDEADYEAANVLIMRESGWNPSAMNSSSGACGLVQALPCSKLGSDWQDPINALEWGESYVNSRYGGWTQALAHSNSTGWY